MKIQDKCTCNKPLSLSHSQQMSKDVNADRSSCNTDWPHVWSVPVCGPCNLFSNQHPTSTVTIQSFPQRSFHFSSNCLWLSTDYPFCLLSVSTSRMQSILKPNYPLSHCHHHLHVRDSKSVYALAGLRSHVCCLLMPQTPVLNTPYHRLRVRDNTILNYIMFILLKI